MWLSIPSHRAVIAALGGAVTSAALFLSPVAAAEPPPNCTAADRAGVASGTAANVSAYLFTHPDVNDFFTSLKDKPRDQRRAAVKDYLNANPGVKADLQVARQPMTDFRARCQ